MSFLEGIIKNRRQKTDGFECEVNFYFMNAEKPL